jgi:hypothetical protein
MISSAHYIYDDDEIRVKYSNLYYIQNKFYYLTIDKDIKLKNVKISNTQEFVPIIKYFNTNEEIISFLKEITYVNIEGTTGYISHFYDWNVAHGLYDSLYPLYLTYLKFLNEDQEDKFNMFINLKYIAGWRFPGISSRDWVLDIFKTFCGGKLIKENNSNTYISENYKFEFFIAGNALSGISSVNKHSVMNGKELNGLEKFRDRMMLKYNINQNINNEKIIIRIIDSRRYSPQEKSILLQINNELNLRGYDSKYISWAQISSFKNQLEIMNKTDIHIAGAGTSMLNFPFLRNNKVHINMGVSKIDSCNMPGLLEVNCCLLSNNIIIKFYDIFKYKYIIYEATISIINENINNIQNNYIVKTITPDYIKIWRKYCNADLNNMNIIINRMKGIIQPHLMGYRHPEILVSEHDPFNEESNLINNNLLKSIKINYNNFI